MARAMRLLARWHIWLGWLTGVPLLLWCVSGLVMVARPIEEVRGTTLRRDAAPQALPAGTTLAIPLPAASRGRVTGAATKVEDGRIVTRLTFADGGVWRIGADGRALGAFTEGEARRLVAREIAGGGRVSAVTLFDAAHPPPDFRRPMAAWQITLADGTHVYVGRDSGAIEAVRTPWWRVYDFFWGLHIMDLQTREDTHHPTLILFAALALGGSAMGTVLLFRRRKTRARA